jgi:hypothetical protein
MIYNLHAYLEGIFPIEDIYCNQLLQMDSQDSLPDRCAIVRESGGTEKLLPPTGKWAEATIQVLARDIDAPKARSLSYDIHDTLINKYGLDLASVTIDSEVFTNIHIAGIIPIQPPSCMGNDSQGRIVYTCNYQVKYRRL